VLSLHRDFLHPVVGTTRRRSGLLDSSERLFLSLLFLFLRFLPMIRSSRCAILPEAKVDE
jgi:hypothetical protein